jgi:hypothetical protein
MLRFQEAPDKISLAILHAALTDALDWIDDNQDDPEDFARVYPESAKCFTPQLAKKILKQLLRASQGRTLYQLTDYHWLLLYEVLSKFADIFNDEPESVSGGSELVTTYGRKKVDFHDFIDCYFWDTDFLADPDGMINMGHESRQSMGLNQEAYAVIQRWTPHPEELALTKVDSEENL